MSGWLKSVGQLLERLDDQAEKVVTDETLTLLTGGTTAVIGEEEATIYEDQRIAKILAARGLDQEDEEGAIEDEGARNKGDSEEQETTVEEQGGVEEGEEVVNLASEGGGTEIEHVKVEENQEDVAFEPLEEEGHMEEISLPAEQVPLQEEKSQQVSVEEKSETVVSASKPVEESSSSVEDEAKPMVAENVSSTNPSSINRSQPAAATTDNKAATVHLPVTPKRAAANTTAEIKSTLQQQSNSSQMRELQKEARTLRKHVVSLHSQLERAEAEIQAQRTELDRAAERIEKDRTRAREERAAEKQRHAAELQLLKDKNEQALYEAKRRADSLLDETRRQLRELEQRHMQEGGDWSKELKDAIQREQEVLHRMACLEDEKATLLSQVSTLQAQQEALGSRLESLTETADNAMAREREAEDRLDEALSLHVRQMSQRNAREQELEQTVADLSAALVAARRSQVNSQPAGDATAQDSSPDDLVRQTLENELETVRTTLIHERQRSDVLQQELREVTRERTEEMSLMTSRQLDYDRKVAEMSREIGQLKLEVRESKRVVDRGASGDLEEDGNHVKALSEEVLRQREAVINANSEISALKSRLKVAIHRAETAEVALERANYNSSDDNDLERAQVPKVRRRAAGGRRAKTDGVRGSMKGALLLDSSQSAGAQRLGSCLDVIDESTAKVGAVLRYNPLARFIFVLYLLILHLWTFMLLMFHAHGSFDTIHGDFVVPHSPHALLQAPQVVEVAADAPAVAAAVVATVDGK